jgi:hypothetical protein
LYSSGLCRDSTIDECEIDIWQSAIEDFGGWVHLADDLPLDMIKASTLSGLRVSRVVAINT